MANARPDDATIIAALEANGGNAKKTAAQLGIPRSTLRYVVGRMSQNARGKVHKDASPEVVADLAENWRKVAEKGTAIALAAMEHIDPAEMRSRDVKELLIGAAVATEKRELLTGRPTQRTESVRIALVDASALRTLAAQMARPALQAPADVEGEYIEQPPVSEDNTDSAA